MGRDGGGESGVFEKAEPWRRSHGVGQASAGEGRNNLHRGGEWGEKSKDTGGGELRA